MTAASYIISGGRSDAARLNLLEQVLGPSSEEFLVASGLRPGARCLDVGCGTGELTRRIARIAAPGEVVGVDMDVEALGVARDISAGMSSAPRFEAVNAEELSSAGLGESDVVHARLLLEHVPDPRRVIEQMTAVCRPGGTVVVQVTEAAAVFTYPACPAMDWFVELFQLTILGRGGNPLIGPRLPDMLEAAGLSGVRIATVQPTYRDGELKRMPELTAYGVRDAVLGGGYATPAEYDDMLTEISAFTADPHTLVSSPRIFQVAGRRGC
jgi:SAM-dependent methyltransferase